MEKSNSTLSSTILLIVAMTIILVASSSAHAQLYVNEVMSSNAVTIADDGGAYSDWFELYNSGPSPVDVNGYFATDTPANLTQWRFPSRIIPAGGYLLVWASNKNLANPTGPLHTNFAIKAGGEPIIITLPDGTTQADMLPAVALSNDQTYGRLPDGSTNLGILPAPSPNSNNSVIPRPPAPLFSKNAGVYSSSFNLTIAALPNTTIRYTLDGSIPTTSSPIYTGPIVIRNNTGDPNIVSMVSTTSPNWQAPTGQVPKAMTVRAVAMTGALTSPVTSATYFLDGTHSMPVLSITTDSANLFDYNTGIYTMGASWDNASGWTGGNTFHPANYQNEGDAWERPVHLEIFDTNGTRVLEQDLGMRITGQGSRVREQKSLKLYARANFGPSSINYPLFGPDGFASYKRLWLRNSDDDERATYLRDVLAHTIVQNTSFGNSMEPYHPAAVFLNGEYWGFYTMRDRASQFFIASRYGLSDKDVIILNDQVVIDNGNPGDEQSFLDMYEYARTHDLSDPANYAYMQTQMDTENFARYYAVNTFIGNTDWIDRNLVYWRMRLNGNVTNTSAPPGKDGRWRWIMHDDDWSFGFRPGNGPDYNMFDFIQTKSWGSLLWTKLSKNEQFRDSFVSMSADQLMTNFAPNAVIGALDVIAAGAAPEIPGEIARWANLPNIAAWQQNLEQIRQFARDRPGYHRTHIAQFFGLGGTATLSITGDDSRGQITVNTLNVSTAYTGIYFQDIPVTVTATPRPGKVFLGWTGIASGTDPTIRVVLRDNAALGAVFADAPGSSASGSPAWVSRKYPATNVNAIEQESKTLTLGIDNPTGVPLQYSWSVDNGAGSSGTSSFVYRGSPGNHVVTVTITGPGVMITQGWNMNVTGSTITTCYYDLSNIPATCTGGSISVDLKSATTRTIKCDGAGRSLTIDVWAKPDTGIKSYFDMYRQTSTGSGVTICLGTACIGTGGFATSPLPVCIATPTNGGPPQNTTNTTTNGTCAMKLADMTPTCVGGSVTSDVPGGCRTVACTNGANNLQILACDKPTSVNPQYFEMYRQSGTGNLKICFGTTCIQDNGYAKSNNYPICTAPSNGTGTNSTNTTDITPPVLSNGQPSGALSAGTTSTTLGVTTNEPAACRYSTSAGTAYNSMTAMTDSNTAHSTLISGLTDGQTYTRYVKCSDIAGNTNTQDYAIQFSVQQQSSSGCKTSVYDLPVSCTGGSVTQDTNGGCRTVTCTGATGSIQTMACNKPGNSNAQYFEMYKQTSTGFGVDVCIAGTCLANSGYVRSPNFPICVNGTGGGNGGGGNSTNSTNSTSPAVVMQIAPWFPQGRNYIFVCKASGFTPTSYDFIFGDGQKNLGRVTDNIYYTYSASGSYTASCTARAGAQQASSTLAVNVQ